MARVLVIDPELRDRVAKLKKYAEAYERSLADYQKLIRGEILPAGDIPGHVLLVPHGFRLVYSLEHLPVFGRCFRVSVSVASDADVVPHVVAMDELLRLLGVCEFLHEADFVSLEPIDSGHAVLVTHLRDREAAKGFQRQGVLPSKKDRAADMKKAGWFFRAIE